MGIKRLGAVMACTVGLILMVGTAPAGAGTIRVEKFLINHVNLVHSSSGGVADADQAVGSREAFTGVLYNDAVQFGAPDGHRIGRVLVDCAVLSPTPDGICTGIAHVPDGYFVFAGNGPFTQSRVRHYAITGGVGPYASARGEITIVYTQGRATTFVVALN